MFITGQQGLYSLFCWAHANCGYAMHTNKKGWLNQADLCKLPQSSLC